MTKEDKCVEVTLTGPAKVGGRWRKVADTVTVTTDEFRHLIAAGAAPGEIEQARSSTEPETDTVKAGDKSDTKKARG